MLANVSLHWLLLNTNIASLHLSALLLTNNKRQEEVVKGRESVIFILATFSKALCERALMLRRKH